MDSHVHRSLLYDFYGHLLTGRQRELFRLHDEEDLSLGEIADRIGVSRQAVYDILKRAEQALARYESKLGLVARHIEHEDRLREVRKGLSALRSKVDRLREGEPAPAFALQQVKDELDRLDRLLSEMMIGR